MNRLGDLFAGVLDTLLKQPLKLGNILGRQVFLVNVGKILSSLRELADKLRRLILRLLLVRFRLLQDRGRFLLSRDSRHGGRKYRKACECGEPNLAKDAKGLPESRTL